MMLERWKQGLAAPRVTDILAVLTALVTAALLLLAVLYWPSVSSRTTDLTTTSAIQGCRSQSNTRVTEARTEFDVARAQRDTAGTHLDVTIALALESVARRDGQLTNLVDDISLARIAVAEAEEVVVDRTADLRRAQARHKEMTQLSIDDPATYLDKCKTFAP